MLSLMILTRLKEKKNRARDLEEKRYQSFKIILNPKSLQISILQVVHTYMYINLSPKWPNDQETF